MGPREFRDSVVLPNVAELRGNYGDLRCAFNAAAAVDALAAQIFAWCQENAPSAVAGLKDDSHYRESLVRQDADFGLLRDVVKAQKHVRLTRGQPQVSHAAQITSKSLRWGEANWDELRWGGPAQVVVVTDDDECRVLEVLVERGLALLEQEMIRCGIA
jgi:hypothetical protein